MKSDLRSKVHKRTFNQILFVYNLKFKCPLKNMENYARKALNKRIEKPGLKFNPGLALISL